MISDRSKKRITKNDLVKLLKLAQADISDFFNRHPRWKKLYSNRLICVALCQGAALHFINKKNGVKDFDVWFFFKKHPKAPFPYRRRGVVDYGRSKFGVHPKLNEKFEGRSIDVIGRSIEVRNGETAKLAIQRYLNEKRTMSAKKLSEKAVILLKPSRSFGAIVWPSK